MVHGAAGAEGEALMILHRITDYEELDGQKLMELYRESNTDNIDYFYLDMADKTQALQKVEERFLNFVQNEFFARKGSEYCVLEKDAVWVSALRLSRIRHGLYYIEALETHPAFRRHGYAAQLLNRVIGILKPTGSFRLCDCVGRTNEASLKAHLKCGFEIVPGPAFDYLRKENEEHHYGMQYLFQSD